MKKHLFLTELPFLASSSPLRELLGPSLSVAGGYLTDPVAMSDSSLRVVLTPAAAAGGAKGFETPVIYERRSSSVIKDNEVFRSLGVRLLSEAVYYPYAVLDRIGGYELVVPQFRNALSELLSSDTPLIGVLLSSSDAAVLAQNLGLGERYLLLNKRLHEALREDADTLLLDASASSPDAVRRILQQWAREYVF